MRSATKEHSRITLSFSVVGALLVGSGSAEATILTFEDLGLPDFGNIPTAYGDNVSALSDATGSYLEGNGFTPNVTVDYRTLSVGGGSGGTLFDHLDFWSTNYGDLRNIAYPVNPASTAEISLVPEAGFGVRLNSFDLGGWSLTDWPSQPLVFYDEDYNVVLDLSPLLVRGAGATHTFVMPDLTHDGILRIQFADNWNVGIDNINFDQVALVPEPSTLLLLSVGVLYLARARGRRRHHRIAESG